ncbi:solute carrier family 44 protein member 2 [Reticulomyxa filosa]|uniref:Choline transporter-like protein n=1 Tax=Reticulomyxa filosa TaxID=46433 RepID=X6NTM9_RETFI|nr:solute carrier family 44 protein member 2 [Reticulomyxa filosa]|eukprot:ETO29308.1 solute carrier family 44 protein member 2 [Reticulomyxa filosa]
MQKVLWYHFFGMIWALQFIIYFTYTVIAHVFATWYFSRWDDNEKKVRGKNPNELPPHPIWNAFWVTTKFHLGTLALGSLIIAIIKSVRYMLTYIQSKAHGKHNPIAVTLYACANCILKNAFIFTAVYGTPFCYSARSAFKLLFDNLARVAAISIVSTYLEFLGKVAITVLTTGICIFVMDQYSLYARQMWGVFINKQAILVLSFAVGSIFMIVFEVAIDSIFFCFLIDEYCNRSKGTMFASKKLLEVIDYQAAASIQEAYHMKQSEFAHQLQERELTELEKRGTIVALERLDDDKYNKDMEDMRPF